MALIRPDSASSPSNAEVHLAGHSTFIAGKQVHCPRAAGPDQVSDGQALGPWEKTPRRVSVVLMWQNGACTSNVTISLSKRLSGTCRAIYREASSQGEPPDSLLPIHRRAWAF